MFAGFGPPPGVLESLLAGCVLAVLIVSFMAAVGARPGATVLRRTLALSCGWLFGVVMAIFAGWTVTVLDYTDSFGGLLLVPVAGAVVGGAAAFTVARSVTFFITWSEGRRMKKLNEQAERLRQKEGGPRS